jgi:hypothetical protein
MATTADDRRFGTGVLAAVGIAAFALGALAGRALLGDLGETPCWEVRGRIEPIRADLERTGGSGAPGQAAARSLAQTAEEHPDCFSPEERAYFTDLRDRLGGSDTGTEGTGGTGTTTDPATPTPSPVG